MGTDGSANSLSASISASSPLTTWSFLSSGLFHNVVQASFPMEAAFQWWHMADPTHSSSFSISETLMLGFLLRIRQSDSHSSSFPISETLMLGFLLRMKGRVTIEARRPTHVRNPSSGTTILRWAASNKSPKRLATTFDTCASFAIVFSRDMLTSSTNQRQHVSRPRLNV